METFEIYLNYDSMNKSKERITGIVSLGFNGFFFPEKEWNDFIIILINNWLNSSYNLLIGTSDYEEFLFMDGPYYLKVKRIDVVNCKIECVESFNKENILYTTRLNINFLHTEIFRNAFFLQQFCEKNNWNTDEVQELCFKIQKMR